MISHNIARKLAALVSRDADLPAERAQGTVTRVDDEGTVWVQLFDGEEETPCAASMVAVQEGDVVSVTIDNGTATVDGNASRPSTDDGAAQEARVIADKAAEDVASIAGKLPKVRNAASNIAKAAQGIAAEAQAIAAAVNQHFWHDGQGVHVTEAAGDATTEHNVLINSLGFLLRKATAPLMALSASAVAFYDGLGDTAANIVARFGKDGSQIGRDGESHVELDYHSMRMVDSDGDTYFYVSDLRDADGYATVTYFKFYGNDYVYVSEIPLDLPAVTTEEFTVTVDWDEADITQYATLQENRVVLDAARSMRNVLVTYKTESQYAKAYTLGLRQSGYPVGASSVAEGVDAIATAFAAHSEGVEGYAASYASHAEGSRTKAFGRASHAEGEDTEANGDYSHAQNKSTKASSANQTAMGRYNKEDANGVYAAIIGNGTSDSNRSNAYAVRWDGTVESALDVPWTLLTLDSACHAYNDATANAPRYRRWGQLVTVTGIIAPTAEVAAGGNMPIATLPAGVRPPQELNIKCQGSSRAAWNLKITAAGVMTAQRYGDETGALPMGTGIWMPFVVTYLV